MQNPVLLRIPANPSAYLVIYQYEAKGFPGIWSNTGFCISLHSFVPIDIKIRMSTMKSKLF